MLIIFDIIIFQVEGIGKKFLPAGYDRSIADKWYKTGDKEGFDYARRLIKQEGLLCGKDSKQSIIVLHVFLRAFQLKPWSCVEKL